MVPKLRKAFQKSVVRNSPTRIGFNNFLKKAPRRGSSWISKIPYWIFVQFKDTLVGIRLRLSWMGHFATPYKWKNSWFIEDVCLMSLQSSNKEHRPSSSHLSTRSGTIHTKKNLAMTHQYRRNVHYHSKWRIVRTPSAGSIQPEHKKRDYDSGRTRSHAVIRFATLLPADCICKVISQKGERTLFGRLSTPRPRTEDCT